LAIDMLRGKFRENDAVMVLHPAEVHLHFPKLRAKANCVMDGELLPLQRDVTIKLHPGELKVLVKQGLAAQEGEGERREPAA
jgi:diacylglycerol kinase family enzyme